MLPLDGFAANLIASEPQVWGDTVRGSLRALSVIAVSGARDHFRKSQGPDGRKWAPLAHTRPAGGSLPLRDRGLLAASLSASVTPVGLALKASQKGANVHQFGATLTAKNAKYLAIPVTKEASRAGSPRKNFPRPLFVLRANGQLYLAETVTKGKKKKSAVVVHYALKKSVKVPARPFVGFSQETLQRMTNVLLTNFSKRLIAAMEGRRQVYYEANPLVR